MFLTNILFNTVATADEVKIVSYFVTSVNGVKCFGNLILNMQKIQCHKLFINKIG